MKISLILAGIVSKIFEDEVLLTESLNLGYEISKYSLNSLILCKEAILKGIFSKQHSKLYFVAQDIGLSDGLEYERKIFHSTFALVGI
jgi:hypothetical protein